MANKLRDAYVVVKLNVDTQITMDTPVIFAGDSVIAEGKIIGRIDDYINDATKVAQAIRCLRQDNLIDVYENKFAFINSVDLSNLQITEGYTVYSHNGLAVVFVGMITIPEEYDTVSLYEVTNGLTEEWLKFTSEFDKRPCTPEEREENSTMDNLFGNMGFGKLCDPRFKLSMNGIAVSQPNGHYVVYNKDNNEFVDVSNTLFDLKDALFLLPAVEVNVGDTILHENKPYYIVDTNNEIKAVSYEDCTQTVLIPKSTMFGIKYFNKIFSMFGDNFAAAGDLFSNPMMLMALMNGKSTDLSQLLLLNSMNNGDLGSNPMALAMLLKDNGSNDSLSTIALMSMFGNGNNPFAPKKAKTKTETK